MSNKVILVLLDGLNYEVARDCMGYLQALVEHKLGYLYKIQCELPSLSRPLYECVLTGVAPVNSGVMCNSYDKLSKNESIFSLCKKANKVTCASAYHWVSELYNSTPFDLVKDRIVNDTSKNIMHGIFYKWDDYPDEAVYADAEFLRINYAPDFLFIHPMNIDDAGHKAGFDSMEYRNSARKSDGYLSLYIKKWIDEGYQVIVTADHGMNRDFSHSGILKSEREVPFFTFGHAFSGNPSIELLQTQICGTVLTLLGISHQKPFCQELIRKI